MNYNLQIVLVLLPVLLFSCSNQEQRRHQDISETITLDMTSKQNGDPVYLDDLLVNLSFVHLEDSNDSYIKEATRIKIHKNRIYIFDQVQNKLFIFTDKGDLITQALTRGKGPGEIVIAKDFDIDIENDLLLVLELSKHALFVYDLDGKYQRTIKLDFYSQFFACLNDDTYAFYIGYFDQSYNNLHLTSRKGKTKINLFPFSKEIMPMNFSFTGFVTRNQSDILYNAACSNEIYQVSGNGESQLKYKVDFGRNAWPENKKYDFNDFMQRISQFDLDFLMNRFEENSDALIFQYQSGHLEYRAFYLKKLKCVYHIKNNLVNDLFYNVLSNPRGVSNDNLFISVMEPLIVRDKIIAEEKAGKTVRMKTQLKEELLASKDNSNLILLFYSLKTK